MTKRYFPNQSTLDVHSPLLKPLIVYTQVLESRPSSFIQYVVDTRCLQVSECTVADGMEAMLVLLRRLAYPNRLCDLSPLFGRAEPELSMIIHEVDFVKVSNLSLAIHVFSY